MPPDLPAAGSAARRPSLAGTLTTTALVVLMTVSGALYLASPPGLLGALQPLGYPAYFLRLLGVAKLLGVTALLLPGRTLLKEWAYAGFTFDLVAAIASHVLTGTASHAPPAAVVLALVLTSYRLGHRAGPRVELASGVAP